MLRLLIVRSLNYSQALSAKEIEALSLMFFFLNQLSSCTDRAHTYL